MIPGEINPLTRKVMAERGFDLSGQHSKGLREFLGKKEFRYLIIVCEVAEQTCPKNFPGIQFRVFWPFDDPAGATGSEEEKLAKFRQVRDQIDQRIQTWLQELPQSTPTGENPLKTLYTRGCRQWGERTHDESFVFMHGKCLSLSWRRV